MKICHDGRTLLKSSRMKGLPTADSKRMTASVPQGGGAGKPRFLDQVRELLRAKYYALRAEEAYLG